LKLEFLKYEIFRKFGQWEPSSFVQMGRHGEADSHFSQFCEKI